MSCTHAPPPLAGEEHERDRLDKALQHDDHSRCFHQEDQMHIRMSRRRALQLGVAGAGAAASLPALAHHGWNWAEDQQSELKGTVKSVSMAPPHPSLKVTAADGKEWL